MCCQTAQVSAMWCFQCGAEYETTVSECLECGVGLVDEPPIPADEVGSEDEEQLAYEFHDWSFESRRMLDQLLTGRSVSHAWQGATMIVRDVDESTVDELVEEVELATLPTLNAEVAHSVYEMAGWSAEHQMQLSVRLGAEGVPHEFDSNGDLVVHDEDEDRLEALLDEIEQNPSALALGNLEDDLVDLDGVDVNQLLSNLFGASDRLRKNARDHRGVLAFLDEAPMLGQMSMPFGYDAPAWQAIVERIGTIEALLDDPDSEDEVIEAKSQELRDLLFTLI